jgi:hypothetical protein
MRPQQSLYLELKDASFQQYAELYRQLGQRKFQPPGMALSWSIIDIILSPNGFHGN